MLKWHKHVERMTKNKMAEENIKSVTRREKIRRQGKSKKVKQSRIKQINRSSGSKRGRLGVSVLMEIGNDKPLK